MATITLEYDGRNTLLKDLLKLIIKNGAKRKKTGIEEAMDDIKEGRVSPAFNNVDEMMKYLGVKK